MHAGRDQVLAIEDPGVLIDTEREDEQERGQNGPLHQGRAPLITPEASQSPQHARTSTIQLDGHHLRVRQPDEFAIERIPAGPDRLGHEKLAETGHRDVRCI